MKKGLKFKFDGNEGFLSVVENSDNYYALVQKETPKVTEAIETHKMWISYELKLPDYKETKVNVLFDPQLTKWVYEKLEEDKNLYFKQLDDSLCVIEISKN